jgi:hypothetical protein
VWKLKITGILDGEKKTMTVVRRRRWYRKRVCITPEAKALFIARYEWIQQKRENMSRFVTHFSQDSALVAQYENRRHVT